mgnify:CR=1 FL=1
MSEKEKQRNNRFCGKTGSVITMITLTASFFLVEVIVGYSTNSMALVADSFHMLSDVMSLVVGFLALRYSKKSQRTERNTFGWQRAEVLGALVNAVFLIALCFSILVESMKRLVTPEEINDPVLVLIVGGAGLFVNLIGMALFYKHGHGHSHGGTSNGRTHSHAVRQTPKNTSPGRGLVLINRENSTTENRINNDSSRRFSSGSGSSGCETIVISGPEGE